VSKAPLPPPLPPETRTVGQLVAETLRLYGRRFFAGLALGVPVSILNLVAAEWTDASRFLVLPPLIGAVYGLVLLLATRIALDAKPDRAATLTALAGGFLVFVPFYFLVSLFVLPGLAWLAFVGLVVPVALVERRSLGAAFRRAVELGRADFVHALGSLATLVIVVFLSQSTLFFLLRAQGEQAARAASVLAGVVVSPILFLGLALLYVDQAARVGSGPRRKES
jgi:hypothetical protein